MAHETYRFEFVDGTAELVAHGSVRYHELLTDGHTPVGSVPESDGVSDALEAWVNGQLGTQVAAAEAAAADARAAADAAVAPTDTQVATLVPAASGSATSAALVDAIGAEAVSRAKAPVYVADYLPTGFVAEGDATAAVQSALDAAGIKGKVILPNMGISLSGEVVTGFTGMTIEGDSEKSYIKLTTAGARIRVNAYRQRLRNFRVMGQSVATNGIFFSNGARARAYNVRVENCTGDGWVLNGGPSGGSNNLITLTACEGVSNGGNGFAVADHATSRDSTGFTLIDCEGTSNTGHGALLRDNQPRVFGGSYMSNGGYGITLGAAGDAILTDAARVDSPRIEGNGLGPFSEGVGTNAIIMLAASYSDATAGGSGGANGYVGNASGNNMRVGYSGTRGGWSVRYANGASHELRLDGSLRLVAPAGSETSLRLGSYGVYIGTGSPEGAVAANAGSVYLRKSDKVELWHKITGTGSTGWQIVGQVHPYAAITADYTAGPNDEVIVAAGSAAKTVTLPSAATVPQGKTYTLKRVGSGTTSYVSVSAVDATAGGTPIALAQWEKVRLVSTGTAWYII